FPHPVVLHPLHAPRDGVFRIWTGAGSAAENARPLGDAFVADPYCGALSGAGDDEVRGRRVGQGVHVCTQSTEPGRVEVDLGRGFLRQEEVTGAPVAHQVDLGDRCGKTGFSEVEACGAEPVVDLDAGGRSEERRVGKEYITRTCRRVSYLL